MNATDRPLLSILMPVFNEARTVEEAIRQVTSTDLGVPIEVVVVDDGSTDGTETILARDGWPAGVSILRHDVNQGKGSAVRTALGVARGEVAAIFDADLEYDPADLKALIEPIVAGEANAVFGVRVFNGYTSHSFLYVLGNRGVTLAANVLFNVYIADLMTCHKVIRTHLFRKLPLQARGFDIEPEIAARLLQRRERIYEIPVHYRARATEDGKKLRAIDGVRVLKTLLRCRFSPRTVD